MVEVVESCVGSDEGVPCTRSGLRNEGRSNGMLGRRGGDAEDYRERMMRRKERDEDAAKRRRGECKRKRDKSVRTTKRDVKKKMK